MKKTPLLLGTAAAALLLSGCIQSPTPAMFEFTNHTVQAVDNSVKAEKTGTSTCKTVLDIVSWGDCSIEAAKRDGKITKINSIDKKIESYAVYGELTTIVRGE